MLLTVLMIALGAVAVLAGLVGCVLPVLPGPPLAFVATWVLASSLIGILLIAP